MSLAIHPDNQTAWDEFFSLSHVPDWDVYSEEIHQAVLTPANSENNNLIYKLNEVALGLHPDDYYLIVNRAILNLRFMRLDRVPKDVARALQLDSRGPAALLAQAQLYNLTAQQDKAEQAYRACLAVSPQPLAYAELGAIEMQKGQIDQALHEYVKATQLGNDKPSWVTTMNRLRDMKAARDLQAKKIKDQDGARSVANVGGRGPGSTAPDINGPGASAGAAKKLAYPMRLVRSNQIDDFFGSGSLKDQGSQAFCKKTMLHCLVKKIKQRVKVTQGVENADWLCVQV